MRLRDLAPLDATERRTRINDGRTARSGRFVFGSVNESVERRPFGSIVNTASVHGHRMHGARHPHQ